MGKHKPKMTTAETGHEAKITGNGTTRKKKNKEKKKITTLRTRYRNYWKDGEMNITKSSYGSTKPKEPETKTQQVKKAPT